MTKISGGHSIPAKIIISSDLKENGGSVTLERGPARIGYAVEGSENVTGGPAQKVYVIEDADLKENGGTFKLSREGSVKIHQVNGRRVSAGPAIPIYMVNGEIGQTDMVMLFLYRLHHTQ